VNLSCKLIFFPAIPTFTPETTTAWSFPDHGDWATQMDNYTRMARLPYVDATSTGATVVGNHRGNWSPFIPRNLILRYTAPGDLVLDRDRESTYA